MVRLLI